MNPPLKTTGLFLTPRGPYGRRLPERARKHMRASEDEKPDPSRKDMQGPAGQAGLDQLAERARIERGMDKNNVPRSLQSQISLGRAEEITDPSQKLPLSERPEPRMTDSAFPPLPQRGSQAATSSGLLERKPTMEELQRSGGPDKAFLKPEQQVPEPPLNLYWGKDFKGIGKTFRW
jgi:hypothetical protein